MAEGAGPFGFQSLPFVELRFIHLVAHIGPIAEKLSHGWLFSLPVPLLEVHILGIDLRVVCHVLTVHEIGQECTRIF